MEFKSFKLSSAAGPLPGKYGNATWTSLCDLFSLPESLLAEIRILGGPKMVEALDSLTSNRDLIENELSPFLMKIRKSPIRRLVAFGDKELKVRIVAILDYFSQSALRRLHSYIFRVLSGITQDVTFDQSSFKIKALEWDYYSSVDLTAATDRFPILVEELVLKGRFPDFYVNAWKQVMIGYPFVFHNKMISYSVGNPMGAYSSFASFALAHHYIVYYCCQELSIP